MNTKCLEETKRILEYNQAILDKNQNEIDELELCIYNTNIEKSRNKYPFIPRLVEALDSLDLNLENKLNIHSFEFFVKLYTLTCNELANRNIPQTPKNITMTMTDIFENRHSVTSETRPDNLSISF